MTDAERLLASLEGPLWWYGETGQEESKDEARALLHSYTEKVKAEALGEAHRNLVELGWDRSERVNPNTWKQVVESHARWLLARIDREISE